jgi:peptidyl-prolyl cis-trans isomerase B (cyclophilin B)
MANRTVVLETTKGVIKMEVYEDQAPVTGHNFLDLVERGFYNGLTFHRYVEDFVIQGGCPLGTGTGGFKDPTTGKERTIPLEVTPALKHDAAGVAAMARSSDPDSASSQFYFTLKETPHLDRNYAVFGRVTEGVDTVLKLRQGDTMTKVYVEKAQG